MERRTSTGRRSCSNVAAESARHCLAISFTASSFQSTVFLHPRPSSAPLLVRGEVPMQTDRRRDGVEALVKVIHGLTAENSMTTAACRSADLVDSKSGARAGVYERNRTKGRKRVGEKRRRGRRPRRRRPCRRSRPQAAPTKLPLTPHHLPTLTSLPPKTRLHARSDAEGGRGRKTERNM